MNDYEKIRDTILAMKLDSDPCVQVVTKQEGIGDDVYEYIKVYINEQLFCLFDYYHKGLKIHMVSAPKEEPVFSGNVQNGHFMQLFHDGRELISYSHNRNIGEIIDAVFGEYEKANKKRNLVASALGSVFNHNVPIECVGFDLCDNKYYLRDWKDNEGVESQIIKRYFDERKAEVLQDRKRYDGYCSFYKYTSLATLLKMLDSQNIRIYSLPAMNDRKEVGFLTSNEEDLRDVEKDWLFHSIMLEADKRYITCFSIMEDDLNMWRLYGDDAKGVCLEFMAHYDTQDLYPIIYEGENNINILELVSQLDDELKNSNMAFKFLSIERKWQYFMKPSSFNYENEIRLLFESDVSTEWGLSSSGVITPYIERGLFDEEETKDSFPMILKRIILGPNMKEKTRNRHQLEIMISNSLYPYDIKVVPSKHNCYI